MMTAQEAKTAIQNYNAVRGLWGAISANRLTKLVPALFGKTPMEAVELALQDEEVFKIVNPFLEQYRAQQEESKLVVAEAKRKAMAELKLNRPRMSKPATLKSLQASGARIDIGAFVQADPELAKYLA